MGSEASEKQLREKQLDFIYIYPNGSEKQADEVISKLIAVGLKGCKYNEPRPFKDWYLTETWEVRRDLYKRATLLLFHVDDNFSEDDESIKTKDETIESAIHRPKENIIAIWYVPKSKLNEPAFDALFGLRSVNGFDPHRPEFAEHIKSLVAMPQFVKANQDREQKQAKELEKYLKQKKNHHIRQRCMVGPGFWKKFVECLSSPDASKDGGKVYGEAEDGESVDAANSETSVQFQSDGGRLESNDATPEKTTINKGSPIAQPTQPSDATTTSVKAIKTESHITQPTQPSDANTESIDGDATNGQNTFEGKSNSPPIPSFVDDYRATQEVQMANNETPTNLLISV